jgi:hypothetical protein
MWTNEEVPHGIPYNHMTGHTKCGRHVAYVPYVAGRRCGRVTVQVDDMGQCLAATWPSHGLPHGSKKMSSEGQLSKIQK